MRSIQLASAALLICLVAGASYAVPTAPARASPGVIARVYACIDIGDAGDRLACYDGAVRAMKTAEAQGEFTAVDAVAVRQIEREAFGFSLPSLPRLALPTLRRGDDGATDSEGTAEVAMTIARIGRHEGRQAFVMDNGQVWMLIDSVGNRLVRPGGAVTIKRAALGSYRMVVEAGGSPLRVRRVE